MSEQLSKKEQYRRQVQKYRSRGLKSIKFVREHEDEIGMYYVEGLGYIEPKKMTELVIDGQFPMKRYFFEKQEDAKRMYDNIQFMMAYKHKLGELRKQKIDDRLKDLHEFDPNSQTFADSLDPATKAKLLRALDNAKSRVK